MGRAGQAGASPDRHRRPPAGKAQMIRDPGRRLRGPQRRLSGRRAASALAIACLAPGGFLAPPPAHDSGGGVPPPISDLVIDAGTTPAGRSVWLRVVDADSGEPAQGIRATVSTRSSSAALSEVGLGYFSGAIPLDPGTTTVSIGLE